jgi:hypothetical protein
MNETRKIAAILAADVVGYGRLAGADGPRAPSMTEVDAPVDRGFYRSSGPKPTFYLINSTWK